MFNSLRNFFRIISYILAVVLGIGLILLLYSMVKWWILLVIPVGIMVVLFPIMMKHGMKILNEERESVYAQLAHNMPLQYNTGRIFKGFTELLLLVWLLPPVPFIIAGDLYVAILPIITVVIIVIEALAANIWVDIGWSKGKYWLMNIGIYAVGIIIGVILNEII